MNSDLLRSAVNLLPENWGRLADKIQWQLLLQNRYFIGISIILLLFALYRRMFKFIAFVFCGIAFCFISSYVAMPGRSDISPENISVFVGVSIALIMVAVYFFFIRSD